MRQRYDLQSIIQYQLKQPTFSQISIITELVQKNNFAENASQMLDLTDIAYILLLCVWQVFRKGYFHVK
jgi:hypothetical protein